MRKFKIAVFSVLVFLFATFAYTAMEDYDINQSVYYNFYTLLISDDLPELFADIATLTANSLVIVSSDDTTAGYLDGKLLVGEGLDKAVGSPAGDETLTISAEDATTTNKGIASFPTDQFTVSSGAVAIKTATDSILGAVNLLNENDMVSDSATKAASQQSIKAYADTKLANISEDTTPQAGGEFDFQAHSAGFTLQTAIGDGTTTIDWKLGNKFKFTFGAQNETFTFTAPTKPGSFTLVMVQDGVGSRTATWPTVKWSSGIEPTLTTDADAEDIVSFFYDGTSYYGTATNGFATP